MMIIERVYILLENQNMYREEMISSIGTYQREGLKGHWKEFSLYNNGLPLYNNLLLYRYG